MDRLLLLFALLAFIYIIIISHTPSINKVAAWQYAEITAEISDLSWTS